MFPPIARIIVITYLTIFLFYCLRHIIPHSINHLIIWNIILWYICTLWGGLCQNNKIIFVRSIGKDIITVKNLCVRNKCSYYPVAYIPHLTLVKYLPKQSGCEKTCFRAMIRWCMIKILLWELGNRPKYHISTLP